MLSEQPSICLTEKSLYLEIIADTFWSQTVSGVKRFKRLRRHRTNTSELWFERRMHSVHLQVGSTSPFHPSMFSNLVTDPGVVSLSEALKQSTC